MKRKPMLLRRLSASISPQNKLTIGLLGVNRGVGVTYTGMLLASYFASERRFKTAYLECNNHRDFALLREAYEWSKENDYSFSLDRITYFKQVTLNRIPEILGGDYDCYILDFGTNYTVAMDEFIRCGNKIIIGDIAIWNQIRMVSFIKDMESIKGSKHWIHMIPYAKDNLIKRISIETKRCFFRIPYEPEPTSLSRDTHKLFHGLFG
ncbi:MAG: hypothetical protein PHC56_03000 [Herbinix sp.]|nr:hypothetical protein [Herbinix sp.]